MKKAVSLFLVLVFSITVLAACAGPMGQRTTQGVLLGGIIGAATGGVIAGGKGAAAGGLIGAGIGGIAGAAIGAKEEQSIYAEPQPLTWMQGKSIQVAGSPSYGYGIDISRAVIEDQLRRRGAIVVDRPGPQYYPTGQSVATDFVAEVAAIEKYNAVVMDIRVLDASRQVRAIGSASIYYGTNGYGYTGDYRVEALRTAAKNAVWALH